MVSIQTINPLVRAVVIVGAVVALATSVTLAALSGSATLVGSSISTTTAALLLWDGDSFEPTAPGFDVTDVVPGEGSAPQPFYFQNDSGVDLDITATVPAAPSYTGGLTAEDVKVTFTSEVASCVENEVETTLALLLAGDVELPCNALSAGAQGNSGVPGTEGNYAVSFDIDPDAPVGSSASVSDFDIVFTGTQPTETETE